ncbi:MAG: hypothetical protein WA691_01650 [Thermoplasmata archaeon]
MASPKLDLLIRTYYEANTLSKYEDLKAARALGGMALLTVAASAIFALAVAGPAYLQFWPSLIKWGYTFFIAFILLVAGGTFFMTGGIFPDFRIPLASKRRPDPTAADRRSFFFAIEISKMSNEAWKEYWTSATDEKLDATAIDHLASETRQTAERIVLKLRWTIWGSRLFLAALFPLAGMVLLMVLSAVY